MSNSYDTNATPHDASLCGTRECSCECGECMLARKAEEGGITPDWFDGPVCPDCRGTCIQPRTYDEPCETCYGEGFLP